MPEKWVLKQYQALPLRAKVNMSLNRIREWYDHFGGDVCVSFSGGKDSTVLAHLVHELYPRVPLVFSNTGLEYPEIQAFARKMGAEFVHPKMRFDEVISKYGYPIISKENAEAIYYARRIRNYQLHKNYKRSQLLAGGVQTTTRSVTNGETGDESPLPVKVRSRKRRRAFLTSRNGFLFAGTVDSKSRTCAVR